MARIPLVLKADFDELDEKVSGSESGLLTRVTSLEQDPVLTLVKPHDPAKLYPEGYPIRRNGVLLVSKKSVQGPFNPSDWDGVGGREDTDPVVLTDGAGTGMTFSIEAGMPTLTTTDGTNIKAFTFSPLSGRINMANKAPLEDSGDNDGVTKGDLEPYAKKAFAPTALPDESKVALVNADGEIVYYSDVNIEELSKLTFLGYFEEEHRFFQKFAPTTTAKNDGELLAKKDGDALYRGKAEYPIGEVFCLGVVKVDTSGDSSATAYGFKYSTVSVSGIKEETTTTDMDYTKFDISGYKPDGSTLTALWVDISGEERDNKFAYQHTLDTAGSAGEIRVYSADNSDWAGDNVMGMDDAIMWVKIWAVASE